MRIPLDTFNGPFSLSHTLRSEQCPADLWKINGYPQTYLKLPRSWIKVEVTQTEKHLKVKPSRKLRDAGKEKVRAELLDFLWADYPLKAFYADFASDPYIHNLITKMKGLRVMKANDLSWSLIEAVYSQNTTVEQVRKRGRLFRKCYGGEITLKDGSSFRSFPKLSKIAKLSEKELREKCNVGYRAKYILNAAQSFSEKELLELKQLSSKKAREKLMQVNGIGPKVADIFLLYGLGMPDVFPMDVHLKKALKREYFRGKTVSDGELRQFALEKFERHAGFAHVYMFYGERVLRSSK